MISRASLNLVNTPWTRSSLKTEGVLRKVAGAIGTGALRGANRFAGKPMPKSQKPSDTPLQHDPQAAYNSAQKSLGLNRFNPLSSAWKQSSNLRKEFADAQAKKLKDTGAEAEHAQKQRTADLASQASYDSRQNSLAGAKAQSRREKATATADAARSSADTAKTAAEAGKLVAQGRKSRYKAQAFATKAKAKRADLHAIKPKTIAPATPQSTSSGPSPAPSPPTSPPAPSPAAPNVAPSAAPKPIRTPLVISGGSATSFKPKKFPAPTPPAPAAELEGGWKKRASGLIIPKGK